ncbi:hypothetical protein ONS95_011746 [Cadophora gregata]|uniref:uncharacterized protein n=1 Tax=Cadophora gregata TaxID=51156 RepID=UPI0026DC748D|nr:uncharacterized protein ONS95_011746 [Cadophora gregata]KAK0120341.1 hypothetical protein ONS95_011746 [Cadophora gregata]KAK0121371.1 hypothetical protein ONS96_011545 [Cadophora gregata f. sp. sojae]
MDVTLEPPAAPLATTDYPIPKSEVTFTVNCHDRYFKHVTITDSSGQELFSAESPGIKSWSWRRTVKGTSGLPLFELRHFNYLSENNWLVKSPSGRELAKIKHMSRFAKQHSALDVKFRNEAAGDEDAGVELHVRPQDRHAITTLVKFKETCVAVIQLTGSNDVHDLSVADRSTWCVRVDAGVDLALILVLVLCRAENHHVFRK